jgi:hypothetical protein
MEVGGADELQEIRRVKVVSNGLFELMPFVGWFGWIWIWSIERVNMNASRQKCLLRAPP